MRNAGTIAFSKETKRDPGIEVSVIVPTYNEEREISDCLSSLVNLNYPKENYEIIVINDGSTDRTAEIIKDFADKYPNIILLSKENGGKGSAQNLGLKQASGRYILITDADAIVERDWISKMINDLEKYDIVLGLDYAKDTNSWWGKIYDANELIKHKFGGLRGGIPAMGVNNGFMKEVAEKIGGFNETKTSVTEDFIKRAEEAGFKYYFNPDIIVFTDCTKSIKSFFKQKLRWRENSLSYLKGEKITFSELLGLGYVVGLSLILFVSFLLSILLLNYRYFLFSFVIVFLISFSMFVKPFLRMCNSKKESYYTKYFVGYLFLEMVIRMMLIPYLAYRLIKPRKRPTFEAERE